MNENATRERANGKGERAPQRPVVISSVTGKPMELPARASGVIPTRATADQGTDSNDERLLRDVPPHWS